MTSRRRPRTRWSTPALAGARADAFGDLLLRNVTVSASVTLGVPVVTDRPAPEPATVETIDVPWADDDTVIDAYTGEETRFADLPQGPAPVRDHDHDHRPGPAPDPHGAGQGRWRPTLDPDGTLTWTSPTGKRRVTEPAHRILPTRAAELTSPPF